MKRASKEVHSGAKGFEEDLEAARRMASELDYNTLWSGLSASRVFDWHDSHFWLLFYADVAAKLRQRVAKEEQRPRPKEVLKRSLVQAQLRFLLHLQMRREQRSLVSTDVMKLISYSKKPRLGGRNQPKRMPPMNQVSGVPKLVSCDAGGTGTCHHAPLSTEKGFKTKKLRLRLQTKSTQCLHRTFLTVQ